MKNRNFILICFVLLSICFKVSSQQYSFSVFAFRINDGGSVVSTLHDVDGFNYYRDTNFKMDSLSQFEISAIYLSEDVNYQQVSKHIKGVWILFAENVKRWRPVRFFSIQKKLADGKKQIMRIFLNYNYHSCEMPCVFGQSEFKVSDIQFNEGNYMFLDKLSLSDWKNPSRNVVKIDGDILNYIYKNNIVLWDVKMIK